ncbi:cellulose biosynthesis cyclic di-GMP-binding regulatory protein BcsB [Bordetella genomosp. 12]|uniref:Cyclic di-GMP-binding protein n=1 Tax=Bordetella genomosp. 12 TaxID=463035 RepID=A0A261VGI3_9BORD|nr:cellulose biosynthesis cyclic di-GMP-binding regulatory protein BcsB [Bordetella genomosp. 12]OZI72263.1 cellulose synthase regulator BcsB [Bordetella genomosp. 12]
MAALSALLLLSLPAAAQPSAEAPAEPNPAAAPAPVPALPAGAQVYSVPLSRLSGQNALPLRGVEGTNGLGFSARRDQRIVGARVNLDYSYSPALLPELSHLKVMLNGEVAGSVALPKEAAAAPTSHSVALPVPALTDFNRLDVQLIGHYTLGCEDPLHSSLWADVAGRSTLDLAVEPVELPNDLAMLPVPFFDNRDIRPLVLPVVLGRKPDAARLESAGILTSWFGALAGYRGARFDASIDALPQSGNAVVLLQQGDQIAGLETPAIQGPSVAVVTHPQDPYGKLLLVMGRDAKELKQAATALALGSETLSGPQARFTRLDPPAPRQPFDAPNWLRSDRPVAFGELASIRDLNVSGYRPPAVQVNLRMPPGLFGWHSDGVPVDLIYRYTPHPGARQSVLEMMAGEQLVRSFALHEGTGIFNRVTGMPASEGQATVMVPTYLLPPLTALQFRYVYEYAKLGECQNSILDNVRSAIDPGSTIDISGLPKYAAMPDLSLFAEAGFPFTRLADLSQTAVVLPDNPGAAEYSAYLDLLGGMGRASGYPATGVAVAQAAQVDALRDKDLLVLASGDNQPLLKQWGASLPSALTTPTRRFSLSEWVDDLAAWFGPDPRQRQRRADLRVDYNGSGVLATLTGIESPLRSGRSVVVVSGTDAAGLTAALRALQARGTQDGASRDPSDRIGGNLTVISEKQAYTLLDEQDYYVGTLPAWLGLQWFFARHPLTLVAALLLSALVIAVLLYLSLRARAQRRLGS